MWSCKIWSYYIKYQQFRAIDTHRRSNRDVSVFHHLSRTFLPSITTSFVLSNGNTIKQDWEGIYVGATYHGVMTSRVNERMKLDLVLPFFGCEFGQKLSSKSQVDLLDKPRFDSLLLIRILPISFNEQNTTFDVRWTIVWVEKQSSPLFEYCLRAKLTVFLYEIVRPTPTQDLVIFATCFLGLCQGKCRIGTTESMFIYQMIWFLAIVLYRN